MTTLRLYFNISLKNLIFIQIYFYIIFIRYLSPQNCSLTKYFNYSYIKNLCYIYIYNISTYQITYSEMRTINI